MLGCSEHRDGRSESAHADVFVGDDVIESAWIEGENTVDGFVVFDASGFVVLVVIHVAGGDDQHGFALRSDNIGDSIAQASENLELASSKRNGDEGDVWPAGLQEWQLDFDGVLGAVRVAVFAERWRAPL